jgi:hypothetical protein
MSTRVLPRQVVIATISTLITSLSAAAPASATVIAYEGFAGVSDGPLAGQAATGFGFADVWDISNGAGGASTTGAAGLAYPASYPGRDHGRTVDEPRKLRREIARCSGRRILKSEGPTPWPTSRSRGAAPGPCCSCATLPDYPITYMGALPATCSAMLVPLHSL